MTTKKTSPKEISTPQKNAPISFVLFLIVIIGLYFWCFNDVDIFNNNKNMLLIDGKQPSFTTFYNAFFNSGLTDIQKEKLFEEKYKDYWVIWEFYVESASSSGEYQVLGLRNPPREYNFVADIGVSFKKNEISKLVNYSKGDMIKIKGQIKSYGNIINKNIVYVKNAIIID